MTTTYPFRLTTRSGGLVVADITALDQDDADRCAKRYYPSLDLVATRSTPITWEEERRAMRAEIDRVRESARVLVDHADEALSGTENTVESVQEVVSLIT